MRSKILLLLGAAAIAAAQQPPGCAPYPNCLYTPGQPVTFNEAAAAVSYRDAQGDTRTIGLYLRVPAGISAVMPVVIWSHNAETSGEAKSIMVPWSETTARAGYLTVTLSHPLRNEDQALAQCVSLRLDEDACKRMGLTSWDWPRDLREVISWLERQNTTADSPLRGRVDMARIAIAGHAEGANGAVSLAGATRLLTTLDRKKPNDFSDPRPAAFISLSPQGPLIEGFYDQDTFEPNSSWMNIARPVFMATGDGDNTCRLPGACSFSGDSPSRRRIAIELMPAGGKYLLYFNSVKISHEFLGSLDTAACAAAGADPALCANFSDVLRSSVVAFLDAHLRGNRAALAWLRDGLAKDASKGIGELRSK